MARVIFSSHDRDDVWVVNQIRNMPHIVGKDNSFIDGVDDETLKSSDDLIAKWIEEQMQGCSCLILFCGEKTYTSKWVKYEIELASKRNMGRFIIHLNGMKCPKRNKILLKGKDPYLQHNLYSSSSEEYIIKQYSWLDNCGKNNLSSWIEDACLRANR